MATKPTKTSIVKTNVEQTSAPKLARVRKGEGNGDSYQQMTQAGASSTMRSGATGGLERDEVAQRAYELYIARGCQHGYDLEDWLVAERELRQRQ